MSRAERPDLSDSCLSIFGESQNSEQNTSTRARSEGESKEAR